MPYGWLTEIRAVYPAFDKVRTRTAWCLKHSLKLAFDRQASPLRNALIFPGLTSLCEVNVVWGVSNVIVGYFPQKITEVIKLTLMLIL